MKKLINQYNITREATEEVTMEDMKAINRATEITEARVIRELTDNRGMILHNRWDNMASRCLVNMATAIMVIMVMDNMVNMVDMDSMVIMDK